MADDVDDSQFHHLPACKSTCMILSCLSVVAEFGIGCFPSSLRQSNFAGNSICGIDVKTKFVWWTPSKLCVVWTDLCCVMTPRRIQMCGMVPRFYALLI
jgi:hypothetical protein